MNHSNRKILFAIAAGENIECSLADNEWHLITHHRALQYIIDNQGDYLRIKDKTIMIAGRDVPAPITTPLLSGQRYWIANLIDNNREYYWNDDPCDSEWLNAGIIHLTQEAAIVHRNALLSFTQLTTAL